MKLVSLSFCVWSWSYETGACLPNSIYVTKETAKQIGFSSFSETLSYSSSCHLQLFFCYCFSAFFANVSSCASCILYL